MEFKDKELCRKIYKFIVKNRIRTLSTLDVDQDYSPGSALSLLDMVTLTPIKVKLCHNVYYFFDKEEEAIKLKFKQKDCITALILTNRYVSCIEDLAPTQINKLSLLINKTKTQALEFLEWTEEINLIEQPGF